MFDPVMDGRLWSEYSKKAQATRFSAVHGRPNFDAEGCDATRRRA